MLAPKTGRLRALGLGDFRRVLDIGAGSGLYSVAFAHAFPSVRVTAVDYPAALPVAQAAVNEHAAAGKVDLVAAEFLNPAWMPPPGHDLVWYANSLHVADAPTNLQLLRKVHAALDDEGTIVIEERVRDVENLPAIRSEITWFLNRERGRGYSTADILDLLTQSGFVGTEILAEGEDAVVVRGRKSAGILCERIGTCD